MCGQQNTKILVVENYFGKKKITRIVQKHYWYFALICVQIIENLWSVDLSSGRLGTSHFHED